MQFLTSLVGGSGNMYLNAALALGVVLLLIILGLWALKAVFRASTTVAYGRNRRLSVLDTLAIDNKRQLIIVRRDNVEHLLLTGGPQDLVVESGFVAEPQAVAPRPVPVLRRGGPVPRATAPQRAPAPQRHAEPHMPAPEDEVGPVHASLDRLRDLGRPAAPPRRPGSLRHTGLMRPVSRLEPAIVPANNDDNSRHAPTDSATTGNVAPDGDAADGNGQAFGRDGTPSGHRDDGY